MSDQPENDEFRIKDDAAIPEVTAKEDQKLDAASLVQEVSTVESLAEEDQPEPLPRVTKTLEAIRQVRLSDASSAWKIMGELDKLPLLHFGEEQKVVKISEDTFGKPEDWFVIGDIHSDFYALKNEIDFIKATNENYKIIFLGDLIDRGPHPFECLWLMLNLIQESPNRILWIAGNHDEALHEGVDDTFTASVYPAEFTEELNRADTWVSFKKEFGLRFIELAKRLPRAALFPDGLLVTHGGFPLVDLQGKLSGLENLDDKIAWLNDGRSLQDFTWTRITGYPKKIPNRASTGCSYGFNDFAAFCEAVKDFYPAKRLLTGHEHPTDGFDLHPEWKVNPALTLKGFGFSNDYTNIEAYRSKYQKKLVVGRYRKDDVPEVVTFDVDSSDLNSFFDDEISKLPQFASLFSAQAASSVSAS